MTTEPLTFNPETERWPTIYDFQQLQRTIRYVTSLEDFSDMFYLSNYHTEPESFYFGDIVQYNNRIPMIDENGNLVGLSPNNGLFVPNLWVVLGNTCDLTQAIEDVSNTIITPLINLERLTLFNHTALQTYMTYQFYRTMYLPKPNITGIITPVNHVGVDFCRLVTISRLNLNARASVVSRMSRTGVMVLHSCLVRFIARDDGRNDPDDP